MANKKNVDLRFQRVTFPAWFRSAERKLASKILDDNPNLVPYQAVMAVNQLCNDGTSARSLMVKALKFTTDSLPTRPAMR